MDSKSPFAVIHLLKSEMSQETFLCLVRLLEKLTLNHMEVAATLVKHKKAIRTLSVKNQRLIEQLPEQFAQRYVQQSVQDSSVAVIKQDGGNGRAFRNAKSRG